MDAARTGRPVLVPDMADVTESARWPVYAEAVVNRPGSGPCSPCPAVGHDQPLDDLFAVFDPLHAVAPSMTAQPAGEYPRERPVRA